MRTKNRMDLATRRRAGPRLCSVGMSDDWFAIAREAARPVVVLDQDAYLVVGRLYDAWIEASLSDYVWRGDAQVTRHGSWRPPYGYDPVRAWGPCGHPWVTAGTNHSNEPIWTMDELHYVARKACPVNEPWLRREVYPGVDEAYMDRDTTSSVPLVYDTLRLVRC